MKFTKEFIALQRRLINNSKVINLHYWGWGFAQAALDEIELLQAENDRLKSDAEQNELILLELYEALKEKQERVQDLEQELKNKCANCGLASHDIWGDEDNVYDNLSTEEE